eukprot:247154_1
MSLASSSKLYQYLQRNPNEHSYRQVIQLPEDTRLEDWLAVVIIEIFDNLSSVYASLAHCCNDMSCPIMSIGISHEYLWHEFQHTNSSIKHTKIHCSAPKYIRSFMDFVRETISNASVFPNESNHEYPPHFHSLIQYFCKQIYRIFGHIYLHHLPSVTSLGLHITMNTCFKHYLYFVEEFNLIKSNELKPLHSFIQISLGRPFGKRADLSIPSHDPNITAFSSIEHTSPNISSLSLPIQAETETKPPRVIARKSEIFRRTTKKKHSLDISNEYKYNNEPSSMSNLSPNTINSITPFPTYAQHDKDQSKINETLNNRSVYEYVFNREMNDTTSSHIAIPADQHTLKKHNGELTQSHDEEEEKASLDYMTPVQKVIQNDIENISVARKCTIIRGINAKTIASPSTDAIEHILSNEQALQRIPLLNASDLTDLSTIEDVHCKPNIYSSPTQGIILEEARDINAKESECPSPSFRDVVYYRSKVRTLEQEVNQLRDENRELLMNKPRKKKKKKKKRPKTHMAKLVDIMNSMNEQITKLAEAVTEAVTSTDEDENPHQEMECVEHDVLETPSTQTDLREYLLGKVLNEEQNKMR